MADSDLRKDKVEDAYRPTQEELDRQRNLRPDSPPPVGSGLSEAELASAAEDDVRHNDPDRNPDAITGAPGSHPVGTGIGAATAGAAGTAIGTMVAPGPGSVIGGAIGAVVGAVAGGYAGKGIAEAINPTDEEAYWREEYRNRPYYDPHVSYSEYAPAYRYGWESRAQHKNRTYEQVEPELERDWDRYRGESSLSWERAKHAARDAWQRVSDAAERATPGDSDRDGK